MFSFALKGDNTGMKLNNLRQDYQGQLDLSDLHANPFTMFEHWFDDAREAKLLEPNAMVLATVDGQGCPAQRNVLLKHYDNKGFVFFTNLKSSKAQHIQHNAQVSLLFSWLGLERQVIVTGEAIPLSRLKTLGYFLQRPRNSQLGAWVSHQSKEIASRYVLETKFKKVKHAFTQGQVPLPHFWGGYCVRPSKFEFWQGGESRLHDRFQYQMDHQQQWTIRRLAP